ncbi:hypothetical protein TNCV_3603251 [Trichonephila clavipes]|nr:hypothetical protein TNCV_3603251 [Trichonephila clavipes]
MAKLFGNWSRLALQAVIRFLWANNVSSSAMCRQHVTKLRHSYQSGRQDAKNYMTGSGRPISSTTEIHTARIGKCFQMIDSYKRAFGDGPRHFEPWSSDEDDT